MSLLLNYSLIEAIELLRGERTESTTEASGFDIDGLVVHRLCALEAAPGHGSIDFDSAWQAVMRAWWGLGGTCGLCVHVDQAEVRWHLLLPAGTPYAEQVVKAHLTGARLKESGPFPTLASRLQGLPFRSAMAGHSATDQAARLEAVVRSMIGREFIITILAKAATPLQIQAEIRRLGREEQFIRDEHLSRPGLEQGSHAAAIRYLSLIEAALARASIASQEGGWQVRTILAASTQSDFQQARAIMHAAFTGDGGKPEPLRWQELAPRRPLTFLRTAEVAALTRPPHRELPGLLIETRHQNTAGAGQSFAPTIFSTATVTPEDSACIAAGRILDDSGQPGAWLDIGINDLCRHVLIAGMTGSGKSITCEHLLLDLWREHRIPWLVIDPGIKASYRRLLNSEIGKDLEVWAVGVPQTRKIPLNPMAAPPGTALAEHTAGLFAIIASAFELVAPMPEVLATAIEQTYRNHGWPLTGMVPKTPPPQLTDLIDEIDRSSRTLGYGAEITGNIRAGLLVRLRRLATGPLAAEFMAPSVFDCAALVSSPAIIELSALPDAASQALVMGCIALQLRHHWRLSGQSDNLRHVTLIEEAHRLLRAVPETAANAARTRAGEDLANMLAELRAMGAGLIIVDQTPSALIPSVIANTCTKILHRLDHSADRELAGRAAGLPADQVDLLGALRAGDAILRSDSRPRPFRVRMPNPSVTYAAIPIPDLPKIKNRACGQSNSAGCSVCRMPLCQAESAGRDSLKLRQRLLEFQSALREGEQQVWIWATREVQTMGFLNQTAAPLCFLMGLGRAANLPENILIRLREVFKHYQDS